MGKSSRQPVPDAHQSRRLAAAVAALRRRGIRSPPLALVLGSGFGTILEALRSRKLISYGSLPCFPAPAVPGHQGVFAVGRLGDVPVTVLAGRVHYYQGYDLADVTFPIRVLAALGVETVVLTNAAGGIHPRLQPGAFMLVADHINAIGTNPLRPPVVGAAPVFVDLTEVYDAACRRSMRAAARGLGLPLRAGVYLAVSGPSYETPAEIRAFRRLGADAVGMSTVPEAVVARQCGMRVVGLSLITNRAAGLDPGGAISHMEVLAAGQRGQASALRLLTAFARRWQRGE